MNQKKLIGINSLFLIPGKVGGTEVFLMNQITELAKIKTDCKYIIYANNENYNLFKDLPGNFRVVKTGVNATNRIVRIIWEQFILPIQLYKDKVELLHSPGYTTPIFTHCKKVTTIFDLNYYFHPEDFGILERFVYSILIPLGARFSDHVIVHSQKSKSEMVDVLGVSKDKITVVYAGVPEDFKKNISFETSLKFIKNYNIQPPYILANSTSHPHKNLESLILAFVEMAKDKKFVHNLVLIGIPGKSYARLSQIVNANNLEKRIQFTNKWIDNSKLKYFYKLADVFVQPSLYEGFGLPLIEALAVGTPVVGSKYSCIPEIIGEAGVTVDTKKPKLIAVAILGLLKNTKKRRKLSELGKLRANIFSWASFGRKIYNLYINV